MGWLSCLVCVLWRRTGQPASVGTQTVEANRIRDLQRQLMDRVAEVSKAPLNSLPSGLQAVAQTMGADERGGKLAADGKGAQNDEWVLAVAPDIIKRHIRVYRWTSDSDMASLDDGKVKRFAEYKASNAPADATESVHLVYETAGKGDLAGHYDLLLPTQVCVRSA